MFDYIVYQNSFLSSLILLFCLPIGCSKESAHDDEPLSLVGTWHCPAPGKPPIAGEWGPTRITYVLHKGGKIDIVYSIESEDGQSRPELMELSGTYKIKETTIETTLEQRVVKSHYALQKDRLVIRNDNGEVYEFAREK
tara:strand:+ start:117490 stop:117906 length:417 start_codon:yes stop_codon:yes gene_type:complete